MRKPAGPMNLRDFVPSQSKGQDGHDNDFISGQAETTKAERETNSPEQYWTGPAGAETKGNLGGEARDN